MNTWKNEVSVARPWTKHVAMYSWLLSWWVWQWKCGSMVMRRLWWLRDDYIIQVECVGVGAGPLLFVVLWFCSINIIIIIIICCLKSSYLCNALLTTYYFCIFTAFRFIFKNWNSVRRRMYCFSWFVKVCLVKDYE